VGVLGILALVLIPFVGFSIPGILGILFCLLAGAMYIFAILGVYEGLEKFEASRIIPAIGGFMPLFIFGLIYLFSGGEALGFKEIIAFIFLILGSVFVAWDPSKKVSFKSLQISAVSAFLFALCFVLTKYVYLMLPFWTGFIWIRISAFLIALFFILFKEVRKEIFSKKSSFSKKTSAFFLFNQGMGAGAFILQNWAIALAGLAYLSIISALQGVQYVFLFILTMLILKEGLSKKVILQKFFAIILIGIGLVFLAF
jgi:drug/metabolite transporter (DMT)-like permease